MPEALSKALVGGVRVCSSSDLKRPRGCVQEGKQLRRGLLGEAKDCLGRQSRGRAGCNNRRWVDRELLSEDAVQAEAEAACAAQEAVWRRPRNAGREAGICQQQIRPRGPITTAGKGRGQRRGYRKRVELRAL